MSAITAAKNPSTIATNSSIFFKLEMDSKMKFAFNHKDEGLQYHEVSIEDDIQRRGHQQQ